MLQHRINLAFAAMCQSYKVQHTALPVDEQQYHAFAAVKRKLLDRLGDAGLVGYGFEQVWTKSICSRQTRRRGRWRCLPVVGIAGVGRASTGIAGIGGLLRITGIGRLLWIAGIGRWL